MANADDERMLLGKKIAQWVAVNSRRESLSLTPMPEFFVMTEPLLDFIAHELGVPEGIIQDWIDEAHDELEGK